MKYDGVSFDITTLFIATCMQNFSFVAYSHNELEREKNYLLLKIVYKNTLRFETRKIQSASYCLPDL